MTFKKYFIVLDGTQETLYKAIQKAKELGYVECSEGGEWSTYEKNILKLDEDGEYYLSRNAKEELLRKGYTELSLDNSPHYVYVSNNSIKDALEKKSKRILFQDLGEKFLYRYLCIPDYDEEKYKTGQQVTLASPWRYIAEIPKEENKTTLTLQEIADKFGIDKS